MLCRLCGPPESLLLLLPLVSTSVSGCWLAAAAASASGNPSVRACRALQVLLKASRQCSWSGTPAKPGAWAFKAASTACAAMRWEGAVGRPGPRADSRLSSAGKAAGGAWASSSAHCAVQPVASSCFATQAARLSQPTLLSRHSYRPAHIIGWACLRMRHADRLDSLSPAFRNRMVASLPPPIGNHLWLQ